MDAALIEPAQAVVRQLLDIAEVEQVRLFGFRIRADAAPDPSSPSRADGDQ